MKKVVIVVLFFALFVSCTKTESADVDKIVESSDVESSINDADSAINDEDSIPELKPERIVAIGDVHGDLAILKKALRTAGAIDDNDNWIGKDLVIVQTGDILDRGDDDLAIIEFLEDLKAKAKEHKGRVINLTGNHELMNIQLDFRYVTEESTKAFEDKGMTREGAFKPGGPYAMILSEYPAVLKMNRLIFVHGGVTKEHALYGIDRINSEYKEWAKGNLATLHSYIEGGEGVFWNRDFSDNPSEEACKALEEALEAADADVMIVGHTIQNHINPECSGKVWRIDSGMSAYYGGKLEILEIKKGKFNPILGDYNFKVVRSKN